MDRFHIWGLKCACFSLCSFAVWGSVEHVTVSANSLAYDENSSSETENNDSYTYNNEYEEKVFLDQIVA